jgi:hypothetical protein
MHKALAKVNGITVISQINLLLIDQTESKLAWVDRDPKLIIAVKISIEIERVS